MPKLSRDERESINRGDLQASKTGAAAMSEYLCEGEPVMSIHSKAIGRIRHIRSNASIQVKWADGSMSWETLSDLTLAPGFKRRCRRLNTK